KSGSDISGGISNSGTISGMGIKGGYGIQVSAANISGGITNNSGGAISGPTYGIDIKSPTAIISIINDGEISGDSGGITSYNGTLNLSGSGTHGAITGNSNSDLNIVSDTSSSDAITGFENVLVKDAATFNLGHNLAATTVTVGEGTSGTLAVGTSAATVTGNLTMA
ncbi:MAG: hypothetical protein GY939_26100, partial [Actinomycetia bacterium]|nr:hypothetical protein [Actinomycetes bacterium]